MSETYLYVIECEGFLKIGLASDVDRRLKSFTTGSPFELSVVYKRVLEHREAARLAERVAHESLHEHHERLEWFSCNKKTAVEACDSAASFAAETHRHNRLNQREKALSLIKKIDHDLLNEVSGISKERLGSINCLLDLTRDEYLKICIGMRGLT